MQDKKKEEKFLMLLERSNFVVALTGAGISTEAGIPDFRGPEGIYTTGRYDPEKTFDISYFLHDPGPFYKFARELVGLLEKARPTFAHFFLAELEKREKLKAIITQNIDGLHQKAGSKKVIELHGTIQKSFCIKCKREFSYEELGEKILKEEIPRCSCGGVIKPDIVFFGEGVKSLDEAIGFVSKSDLLIVIGSSLAIYPAAQIPSFAMGKIVIVNREKPELALNGDNILFIQDDIDNFFKKIYPKLR